MALQPREPFSTDGSVDTLQGGRVRLRDLPGKKLGERKDVQGGAPNPFNVLKEFAYHLAKATAIAIAPATAAVVVSVGMWVGSAVPGINTARSNLINKEATYLDGLRSTQSLLTELESLGAPSDQLQVVYFAYSDAEGSERRRMADTYLGVLVDQVADARMRRGDAAQRLAPLIARNSAARREAANSYRAWLDVLATPRGRMALWFGLVSGPDEGMEIYDRPHPRAKENAEEAAEAE